MAEKEKVTKNIKRVSDFIDTTELEGNQVKVDDILDRDIIIMAIQHRKGADGPYLIIQATDTDGTDQYKFSCGGVVVVERLTELAEKKRLPILAKIYYPQGKRYLDII